MRNTEQILGCLTFCVFEWPGKLVGCVSKELRIKGSKKVRPWEQAELLELEEAGVNSSFRSLPEGGRQGSWRELPRQNEETKE